MSAVFSRYSWNRKGVHSGNGKRSKMVGASRYVTVSEVSEPMTPRISESELLSVVDIGRIRSADGCLS